MSNFITGQHVRKKLFLNLYKFFHELEKILEAIIQNRLPVTKNSYYPKVSYLDVQFIAQIYDYTRSLFEVQIKKFEDILKYIK